MTKPKYTYEDWKSDLPFHKDDSPLPDEYPINWGMTLSEINRYQRNSIIGLIEEEFLFGEELEKIDREQSRCYQALIDAYTQKLIGMIDSESRAENFESENRRRLYLINAYLEDPEREPLMAQVKNRLTPHQNMSGPLCKQILDDISDGKLPEPFRVKRLDWQEVVPSPVSSQLAPHVIGYRLDPYFEAALLQAEREKRSEFLDNTREHRAPAIDKRGAFKKRQSIRMGDDFYVEANRIYRDALEKGEVNTKIRTKRNEAVSDYFVGKLSDFMGYETSDVERLHPKKPSRSTIKRILVKDRKRWEY